MIAVIDCPPQPPCIFSSAKSAMGAVVGTSPARLAAPGVPWAPAQPCRCSSAPPQVRQRASWAVASRCLGDGGGDSRQNRRLTRSSSRDSNSTGGGGDATGTQAPARMRLASQAQLLKPLLAMAALVWFSWKQVAAAGSVLPPAPWGGGTAAAVMAAFTAVHMLASRPINRMSSQMARRSGSTAAEAQAQATVAAATPWALVELLTTAAILKALVLDRYPHALSLGLFSATPLPLRAWLPAVAAGGALHGCLLLLRDKALAAAT